MSTIIEEPELYIRFPEGNVFITSHGIVNFAEMRVCPFKDLEYIYTEAKALREYRKSRMPGINKEYAVRSHCCKSHILTKDVLIDSLHKEQAGPDVPSGMEWSHSGKYEPFNPEQTLIPKVDKGDNNNKEVIEIKHEKIKSIRKKVADACNKPQVLEEVPAFTDNTLDCTLHTCNTSQYWITTDGRIKIDPPAPYDVFIYTTVAEIQRLRAMSDKELMSFYRAYEKQTYPNKRYALRSFLRDIAGSEFPPTSVTIPHGLDNVPASVIAWPVASEEHALEHTITPDPADSSGSTSESIAEDSLPEVTATLKPEDPYVVKTRMSKKTAALWEKFADPAKVKQ